MEKQDPAIEAAGLSAQLQEKWNKDLHQLFQLMRRLFTPQTMLTVIARDTTTGDQGVCVSMEADFTLLRAMLDRLERDRAAVASASTQIVMVEGIKRDTAN